MRHTKLVKSKVFQNLDAHKSAAKGFWEYKQIKGGLFMSELSILDLQNLRHLIGGYETTHCKMTDYASKAEDPEVKQLFQDAANSAVKNKQELMNFL